MWNQLPQWAQALTPIVGLLIVISLILKSLPRIDLGHAPAFLRRRRLNWLPLGLTYAFLYMGRYNLTVASDALRDLGDMSNKEFGQIFMWGTLTYGFSFLINGPLTDRWGGRRTIMIAAFGSGLMNLLMGAVLIYGESSQLITVYSILYSLNMYFQSFGAVSIVKVNAHWFHVRERGVLGGVFGILISLGVYFAFDWNKLILEVMHTEAQPGIHWVFFAPAALLMIFGLVSFFLVYDTPSDVGHPDFDVADASSGEGDEKVSVKAVFVRMFTNPIIMTIAGIEFCSGYLRQAIMQWGRKFLYQTGQDSSFVYDNWGMLLCVAGITGGMLAGTISDHVFGSRRGPVATVLYAGMLIGCIIMIFVLEMGALGWLVVVMSLCIIGVHGMLSGTASMDFGGKKNAGVAVGIIDGCVYLGTGLQSGVLAYILPEGENAILRSNWSAWPLAMLPLAVIGLLLAIRIWNARPSPGKRAS